MEINPQIVKNHDELSLYNSRFHHFVNENPAALKAESFKLLELNDKLKLLNRWPTFVRLQKKEQFQLGNRRVFELLRSIPRRIFGNDIKKICNYYGISESLAQYSMYGLSEAYLANLLARGDFVTTPEGFKVLEFNVNSNLGGLDIPFWETLYLRTPVIAEFFKRSGVKTHNVNLMSRLFLSLYHTADKLFPGSSQINVALVMPEIQNLIRVKSQELIFNNLYREILKTIPGGREGQFVCCHYSQLQRTDNGLTFNGIPIHHIFEWTQGYVPRDILELFNREKVSLCNGPLSMLLSTKLNIVLLSEHETSDLFEPHEREVISQHIPWTRRMTHGETDYKGENVQLEDFVIANREKLVLKPLLGTGGKDVVVGCFTSPQQWRDIVTTALNQREDWKNIVVNENIGEQQWYGLAAGAFSVKSWLVQEYIDSPLYIYQYGDDGYAPYRTAWGYFLFGEQDGGLFLRTQPTQKESGVVNAHQGASMSVVFETDE